MKNVILICFGLFAVAAYTQEQAVTTIYMLRHAEKADGTPNPDLSDAGLQRAQNIAKYFDAINIDLFYSTPYKRTQQTCSPTANSKRRDIITYAPDAMNLKVLAASNPGKTILIVGHSNTIPKYINTLLGNTVYDDMPESEFGNLYRITVDGEIVTHELTKI